MLIGVFFMVCWVQSGYLDVKFLPVENMHSVLLLKPDKSTNFKGNWVLPHWLLQIHLVLIIFLMFFFAKFLDFLDHSQMMETKMGLFTFLKIGDLQKCKANTKVAANA